MKYNEQELLEAVSKATSIRTCLKILGRVPKGGNYKILKSYLDKFNIDYSHFTGKGWRKGKTFKTERKKLDQILCKNSTYKSGSPYQSSKIKELLFKNKIKDRKCEICNIEKWRGKDLSFELHHIDGDSQNNELQNLQILCPNCHSLTENFRGKNIK